MRKNIIKQQSFFHNKKIVLMNFHASYYNKNYKKLWIVRAPWLREWQRKVQGARGQLCCVMNWIYHNMDTPLLSVFMGPGLFKRCPQAVGKNDKTAPLCVSAVLCPLHQKAYCLDMRWIEILRVVKYERILSMKLKCLRYMWNGTPAYTMTNGNSNVLDGSLPDLLSLYLLDNTSINHPT